MKVMKAHSLQLDRWRIRFDYSVKRILSILIVSFDSKGFEPPQIGQKRQGSAVKSAVSVDRGKSAIF